MISLLKIGSFPWQTFNLLDGKKSDEKPQIHQGIWMGMSTTEVTAWCRSQAKTLYYCPDNVYGRWVSDGLFFTFQVTDVWSLMQLMSESGEFLVTYWCVISSDQQVMGRSQ